MALLFDGGAEQPPATTAQPWVPFSDWEVTNNGYTTTSHAEFGTGVSDTSNPHKGNRSLRTDIAASTTSANTRRGEAKVIRAGQTGFPTYASMIGTDDYYCLAYRFQAGAPAATSQYLVNQLAWNGLHPPVVTFRVKSDHFTLVLAGGRYNSANVPVMDYNSDGDQNRSDFNLPGWFPRPASKGAIEIGVWHQFILRVRWMDYTTLTNSSSATGIFQCWYRLKGDSNWLKTIDTTTDGSIRFANMQSNSTGTLGSGTIQDKCGPYVFSGSNTFSTWFEMARASTFADADAWFPAAAGSSKSIAPNGERGSTRVSVGLAKRTATSVFVPAPSFRGRTTFQLAKDIVATRGVDPNDIDGAVFGGGTAVSCQVNKAGQALVSPSTVSARTTFSLASPIANATSNTTTRYYPSLHRDVPGAGSHMPGLWGAGFKRKRRS